MRKSLECPYCENVQTEELFFKFFGSIARCYQCKLRFCVHAIPSSFEVFIIKLPKRERNEDDD